MGGRTGIRFLVEAVKRECIPVRPEALTIRIPIIKAGFDTDDSLIFGALDRSVRGLVVEGLGMGHRPAGHDAGDRSRPGRGDSRRDYQPLNEVSGGAGLRF